MLLCSDGGSVKVCVCSLAGMYQMDDNFGETFCSHVLEVSLFQVQQP